MRKQYDLSQQTWRRNPYVKPLKKSMPLRLDEDLIQYFKELGKDIGIPYQRLINMVLRECATSRRKAVAR